MVICHSDIAFMIYTVDDRLILNFKKMNNFVSPIFATAPTLDTKLKKPFLFAFFNLYNVRNGQLFNKRDYNLSNMTSTIPYSTASLAFIQ